MKKLRLIFMLTFMAGMTLLESQTHDWLWVEQVGEYGTDIEGRDITKDADGNIYVTGNIRDGEANFGSTTITISEGVGIYVAKIDKNGNWLFATSAVANNIDSNTIGIDNDGNVYVAGRFSGTANFGSIQITSVYDYNPDIFIAKLNNNGAWEWVRKKNNSTGYDLDSKKLFIDVEQNIHLTGFVSATPSIRLYYAKYNPNGNLLTEHTAGGSGQYPTSFGMGITVDIFGNTYLTGRFKYTMTFGGLTIYSNLESTFVLKLNAEGTAEWIRTASNHTSNGSCRGNSISLDKEQNVYVVGTYHERMNYGNLVLDNPLGNYTGGYLAKLSNNGEWLWAKHAGGEARDVDVDSANNVFVSGIFEFPAEFAETTLISSGGQNTFVAQLNAYENWEWAMRTGAIANAMRATSPSEIYVVGKFTGTVDFGDMFLTSHNPGSDAFVAKIIGNLNLSLLSPLGGEVWRSSTQKGIYWVADWSVSHIDILFSYNGGSNWINLNPEPIDASLGNFFFTVPATPSDQCLIKIRYLDASDVINSTSPNPFSIVNSLHPYIQIDNPDYPDLKLHSNRNIEIIWSHYQVDLVNLDVSYNKGVTWQNIVENLQTETNSYIWQVPDSLENICYFRVSDTQNSANYDWSNHPFIIAELELIAPESNEVLMANKPYQISWQSENIDYLNLHYSSDYGNSWVTAVTDIPAENGTYEWIIPNVPSTEFLIKLSDKDADNVFVQTTMMIRYLEIIDPNQSELIIQSGKPYWISWMYENISSSLKIDYSLDNGITYTEISTEVLPEQAGIDWLVPNTNTTTGKIKITLVDEPYNYIVSDNFFAIASLELLSPVGGEIWGAGTTHNISWNAINLENVTLEYTNDEGGNWHTFAEIGAEVGFFSWLIPDVHSSQCKVRVSDLNYSMINDTNEGCFTIRPQIILDSPIGGETLTYNTIHSILWNSSPEVSFIRIDYSIDSGESWIPIQSSPYPALIGVYDWIIPNTPTSQALLRIVRSDDNSVYAISENFFWIVETLQPPIANFTADVTEGLEPLSVNFFDESYTGSGILTNWYWDFGDGINSEEQNPQHTYQNHGIYNVSLTVTNLIDSTSTMTKEDYITVIQRLPEITLLSNNNLSFGSIWVEEQSSYKEVNIKNTGTADLVIGNISLANDPCHYEFFYNNDKYLGAVNQTQNLDDRLRNMVISPDSSDIVFVRFTPQSIGTLTDTLFIVNNSINNPILKIGLTGIGQYVPAKAPENVIITMDGINSILSWDEVTENEHGYSLTPDYYFVYSNGSSDPSGEFYFSGLTQTNSYTHQGVGLAVRNMFYRINAVKIYRGNNNTKKKIEVERILNTQLKVGMPESLVEKMLKQIIE